MRKLFSSFLLFCVGVLSASAQSGSIELSPNFSEREVMIHVASGNLYGTLTIPLNNELGIVALVIPDFGLTDRDGNSAQAGDPHSLKMLAEDLAKEGISTLRLEKREVTESKASAIVTSGVRIEDMVEDAVRWLRFLKADKRFSKLAVIGHGEGALVGMLASEITDISYYISIGGHGKPGYDLVETNLAEQLTPEQMNTARMYIDEMKKGNLLEDVKPALASIFNPAIQLYLVSWFKYNPVIEIANLKANILLVQGSNDTRVSQQELALLASAYPKANKLLIDGMDHILKPSKEKQEYSVVLANIPLASGLVDGIAAFLKDKNK